MTTSDPVILKALASVLPDTPRWIETRSTLLSSSGQVFGLTDGSTTGYVTWEPAFALATVVGQPEPAAIRQAAALSAERGVVVCQVADEQHVAAALQGWTPRPATLHFLANSSRLPRLAARGPAGMVAWPASAPAGDPDGEGPPSSDVHVRFLTNAELEKACRLAPDLRAELEIAFLVTQVAATVVNEEPVSFCYAGSVTESLWDISIDTLGQYRRKGYASLCAAFLVEHMLRQEKRPVWGAEDANEGSMALARKLGFVPVDRVIVFHPPGR